MKNGEVILVATNYRLGPLGFLSMGNNIIPGNAGMKDQVMALNWVKDNIENFGGDPNLVTIFGESAGSESVAMHIISPMSKGLFQRGIMQSGTAIGPSWGTITPEKAVRYANVLSEQLGCGQADNVVTCLQDKNMEDIIGLSYNVSQGRMFWVPVSDKDFSSEPFLPGDAEELMKSGQFNTEVEVIIGTNEAEGIMTMGSYIIDPSRWEETKNNIEILLPIYLFNIGDVADITDEDVDNMYKILNYYIGSVDNFNEAHIKELIQMCTDCDFLYGTYKTIKYFLEHEMTVFPYILTHRGTFSFSQRNGVPNMGVTHGDDLIYLFDPIYSLNLKLPENDWMLREVMTTAWINFATIGDPTPPDSGLTWAPVNAVNKYFNISGPYPVMENHNQEILRRMEFWDEVLAANDKN